MNKELILKYKTEFDHWLNDKEVLACPIKNKLNGYAVDWQPIDENALWNNENIAYIINDEYSELRKALAEGKTVQLNEAEKFADSNRGWADLSCISLGDSRNLFPVNYYRIKPEEPKFKVGDWVRQGNFTIKVHRVESNYYYDKYSNRISVEKAIKWQPKPSEWCWNSIFGLVKVICEATENENPFYLCWNPWKKLEQKLPNLEPFIGELPSHLKD